MAWTGQGRTYANFHPPGGGFQFACGLPGGQGPPPTASPSDASHRTGRRIPPSQTRQDQPLAVGSPGSMRGASTWKGAPPLPSHPRPTCAVGLLPASRPDWLDAIASACGPGCGLGGATISGSRAKRDRHRLWYPGTAPWRASSDRDAHGRSGTDRAAQGRGRAANVAYCSPPGPTRPPSRLGASGGPDRAAGSPGCGSSVRGAALCGWPSAPRRSAGPAAGHVRCGKVARSEFGGETGLRAGCVEGGTSCALSLARS